MPRTHETSALRRDVPLECNRGVEHLVALFYCSCSLLFGHAGHLVLLGLPLGWYERVGRIMGDCVSILDDSALNWGGSDLICAGSLAVARSDLRCSVSSCSVSGK